MKNQFPLKLRDFLTIQTEKPSQPWPYMQISYLCTRDDCNTSASMIINLLGDLSQEEIKDNTFENKEYKKSPIINELFKSTPPDENNETHSLFQITHHENDFFVKHTYVIEKGWNANENAYRYKIHQSYSDEFTLPQWEGTDDSWTSSLTLKNSPIIKRYDQFRGKQLTLTEIEKFIEQEIELTESKKMEASMYVIDNLKIQQLETCLEAQFKGDQKQEKDIFSQSSSFIPTNTSGSSSNEKTHSNTMIPATSSRPEYDSLALRQCGFFSKINFGVSALEIFKQTYITLSQVMPVYPPFLNENLTKPNNKM